MSVHDAVIKASKIHLQPPLIAALTAGLGIIPIAMTISPSLTAEMQRLFAPAILDGLITSMWCTLVVLPVIFDWFLDYAKILSDTPSPSKMKRTGKLIKVKNLFVARHFRGS